MSNYLEMTVDLAKSFADYLDPEDLPAFISRIRDALEEAEKPKDVPVKIYTPAAPIRTSVKPDHIISLIDGKPYKSLKRHILAHDLTPDEYRARYGLKADYPMVCADYSERRRELAKVIGLGKKKR